MTRKSHLNKKAILLVGFNNWGKTTHIHSLFRRYRFDLGRTYLISPIDVQFTVESASNDDLIGMRFIEQVEKRIVHSPDKAQNLFAALCPSREPRNDCRQLLSNRVFQNFEVHLLFLKYKWDHHAELRIGDIQRYLAGLDNLNFHTIDGDANQLDDLSRATARESQIVFQMEQIYAER